MFKPENTAVDAQSLSLPSVGIVGFGLVGSALAHRLKALGYRVSAYDIQDTKRLIAQEHGLAWFGDVPSLANASDVIVLSVLDDNALALTTQAFANILTNPKLVVSCVTASQAATLNAARHFTNIGIAFIDMPLLGSSRQIQEGKAIGLLGAAEKHLADWKPLLLHLAGDVRHVGPVGQGVAAKIACNLVLGLNRSALAEGMGLANAMGITPSAFLALLQDSPAYSKAVDTAGPRMAARQFAPVSRISQHRKDLGLMLDAAEQAGIPSFLLQAQTALLDQAILHGLGDSDNVAIFDLYLKPNENT